MQIGTSHFKSVDHAIAYYANYNATPEDVKKMISDGAIAIGKAGLKLLEGEAVYCDSEGRYIIDTMESQK